MKAFVIRILVAILFFIVMAASKRHPFVMDERWVCSVKKSCFTCLKLQHCSWCETENICFSNKLAFQNVCNNTTATIEFTDYGFSVQENAKCSCARGKTEKSCYPSKNTEGPECSGRGTCVCGRCVCKSTPDSDNPTKVIMGKYCELDNFSCEGPNCKEGPYSIIKDNEKDNSYRMVNQE